MTNLVLLPGTLCTAAAFDHQVTHLADVADALVLPLSVGETVAECAAWVLAQAPETFALAGFSQGAIVALKIMRQAPERVAKLALLDANPGGSTPEQLATWARWREEARAGGFANIVEGFTQGLHPQAEPGLKTTLERMAAETGVDSFSTQLDMLASRVDSRPYLPFITCPTLLLVGRQDRVTPLELHEEMARLIPNAALMPIEDSGHYSMLEQPQAVTAVMRYWLTN